MTHAFYNFSTLFFRLFYYCGFLVYHIKDLNIQKGKVLQMNQLEIDVISIIIIARVHVCIYVLLDLKCGLQKPDRVRNTFFNEIQ